MRKKYKKYNPFARLDEARKNAVTLRKCGARLSNVAEYCKLSRSTVIAANNAFKAGGWDAVKLKKRGSKPGTGMIISREQERQILKMIFENTPDGLNLSGRLWTTSQVMKLVQDRLSLSLSDRVMRLYFSRWLITYDQLSNRNPDFKSKNQRSWFDINYVKIKKQAVKEQAAICWLSYRSVAENETLRSFATERTGVKNRAGSVTLVRALSSKGGASWKIYDGVLSEKKLIDFYDSLCDDLGRKVIVILEQFVTAKSIKVNVWLNKNKSRIEVFYLPRN